jgi:DNA-binding CsgD family transcriptional regulator
MTRETPLWGREKELDRLDTFVAGLSHEPGAILITGEPGIGKTALWRAAAEKAKAMGTRLLITRCTEAELQFAFGGLGDLLEAVIDDVGSELSEPHQRAIAIALGREDPVDRAPDSIALPRAVTTALRLLGAHAPTLIAIDDVSWLDPASRRVLGFALKRVGDVRIGVLVTSREEADPLDLVHTSDRFEVLKVPPLNFDAIRQLVRSCVSTALSRSTLMRIHEASGGNPKFALEIARTIDERPTTPASGPLPLPRTLETLVEERMQRLPGEVRTLLGLISTMERPTTALLRQITEDDFDDLLDAAVSFETISVNDDGSIRFLHPLLASAAYSNLTPSSRRATHARIAAVVDDIVSRGRHISLASDQPSSAAAAVLDAAAETAAARGAPDAAAELARRAVELTPSTDQQRREDRVLAVAEYLCNGLEMAAAAAWIDRILANGLSDHGRVRALLLRFEAEHDVEQRGHLIAEALEYAGEDPTLITRVLLAASLYWRHQENLVASEAIALEALAAAEESGDPMLMATAISNLAARMGSPDRKLIDRATALSDVHGLLPRTTPPRVVRGEKLLFVWGQHLAARPVLEEEHVRLHKLGKEFERHRVAVGLGYVELMAGDWHAAGRYFEEAFEVSVDGGHRREEAQLAEPRARLAAYRGDIDEARRLASPGISFGERHWSAVAESNLWVLGHVELVLGNPQRAWELLASVCQRIELDWAVLDVPDAVEALVALGRHNEAETLLTRFENCWIDHQWAVHAGARCRGSILLARGDSERALQAADDASAGFEADGYPFDRGRSHLLAGEVLRRRGERRRAAEKLEQAKAIFTDLGATLWLERTNRELSLANPRPRNHHDLTNAEQAVARLVVLGHTNREVAAQLFITVPTVEAHLTRIYRKLGIRSRTQLARRVADGELRLRIGTP